MIKHQQVKEWLDNPVTRLFLQKLEQHRHAHYEAISELVLNKPQEAIMSKDVSCELLALKNQIHTIDYISDLETFLEEEEVEDEVQTNQMSLYSED